MRTYLEELQGRYGMWNQKIHPEDLMGIDWVREEYIIVSRALVKKIEKIDF